MKKLYENNKLEVWVDPQELEDKVLYNTDVLDIEELVEEFKKMDWKDVQSELDYYQKMGVKVITNVKKVTGVKSDHTKQLWNQFIESYLDDAKQLALEVKELIEKEAGEKVARIELYKSWNYNGPEIEDVDVYNKGQKMIKYENYIVKVGEEEKSLRDIVYEKFGQLSELLELLNLRNATIYAFMFNNDKVSIETGERDALKVMNLFD